MIRTGSISRLCPRGSGDNRSSTTINALTKQQSSNITSSDESESTLMTYLMEDNDSDELQTYNESIAEKMMSYEHPPDKAVRFGTVELRVFPITLGDNPACTHGPPITIEWDHVAAETMPVDVWESNRQRRRCGEQLKLQWLQRRIILKDDVSEADILRANQEIRNIHQQRLMTISRLKYEKVELFTQSLFRKMKRTFTRPTSPEKILVTSSESPWARRRSSLGMKVEPPKKRPLFRGNSDSILEIGGDEIDAELRKLTHKRRDSFS